MWTKIVSLIQAAIIGTILIATYTIGWFIIIPLIVVGAIYFVIHEDKTV